MSKHRNNSVKHGIIASLMVCVFLLTILLGGSYAVSGNSLAEAAKPNPTRTVTVTATPPTVTATVTKTVTATATVTQTVPGPTTTVTAPGPTVTVTGTPTATATATATGTPTAPAGATCTDANAFVNWNGDVYNWTDTSASVRSTGGWGAGGMGDYYADAGMWNVTDYNVTQHTVYCDHNSWYVVNTSDNNAHDGAVKSYPNNHMDFIQWGVPGTPLTPMSNFNTMLSNFANTRPSVTTGLNYDTAYDIWFNDVGNSNTDNEVMIWTDRVAQQPLGSKVTTTNLFGHQWDVWVWSPTGNGTADSTGAQYIALLPTDGQPILSGQIDVVALYRTLNSITVPGGKLLPDNSTIGQVGYGVEFVSTGGNPVRWDFTDFDVTYTLN